jgi:hypothetical protein
MSKESRRILEYAKKSQEEAHQAMIAPRETQERIDMDQELQKILFQLLGALNHASHMITQVLSRGHGSTNSHGHVEHEEVEPTYAPVSSTSSALDRLNEQREREGADTRETEVPRRRAAKGSFKPPKEDLKAMRDSMTIKQIGEKYGVSMATVMNRLRDAGLTTPRDTGKKGGRKKG